MTCFCRFADIGFPYGMGSREIGSQAAVDSWLAAAARMFPSSTQTVKIAHAQDQETYAEPGNVKCVLYLLQYAKARMVSLLGGQHKPWHTGLYSSF